MHSQDNTHNKTWHILGAGAVGRLLAKQVSQQFTVSLINRKQTAVNFIFHNYLTSKSTKLHFDFIKQPISNLIICTKAFDALPAFNTIKPLIQPNSNVFCCFNGYGAQQLISKEHPNTFYCSNTFGAFIKNNQLYYTGKGEIKVGPSNKAQSKPKTLPNLWQWQEEIEHCLLIKVAINSIINPLSVIYHCRNGQIAQYDKQCLIPALANEICLILQQLNLNLTTNQLIKQCLRVMSATAENNSSMLQDFKQQRPSEIEFMNGFFIRQAKRLKLDFQANLYIQQQVKQIWPL